MPKNQRVRNLASEMRTAAEELAGYSKDGNMAAGEALRSIAETLLRVSGIVTQPGLSRARRKQLMEEALKEMARVQF